MNAAQLTQRLLDDALRIEPNIEGLEVVELFGDRAQALWDIADRLWTAEVNTMK